VLIIQAKVDACGQVAGLAGVGVEGTVKASTLENEFMVHFSELCGLWRMFVGNFIG
jgi:hypothetical protein